MLRCRSKRKVLFQNIVMTRITGLWWRMQQYFNYHSIYICSGYGLGCRGCDRMLVGFIATYAVNGYHHSCCEFESHSGEVYPIQHYVIKLVSDLRQVGGFLGVLWFPLSLIWQPRCNWNIVESDIKHHNPNPCSGHGSSSIERGCFPFSGWSGPPHQ